jgi:hypothetical protein
LFWLLERRRERISENLQKIGPEQKVVSLILRENMINLAEAVTEKEPLRNFKISLVISCLGKWVARVLIMSAYEPMVGWKGKHPQ